MSTIDSTDEQITEPIIEPAPPRPRHDHPNLMRGEWPMTEGHDDNRQYPGHEPESR